MAKESIESGEHIAIVQKWEEIEVGWGHRPDGFSLHTSYDGLKKYIDAYWKQDNIYPEEYSRPCGTPYEAEVGRAVIAAIEASEDGIRYWEHEYAYPGDGGPDGWKPIKR